MLYLGCSTLKSIILPSSATSISSNLMYNGCRMLTNVTITANADSAIIGSSSFQGITSIAYVSIATGITTIGDASFQGK
jgi:hypothetical protein